MDEPSIIRFISGVCLILPPFRLFFCRLIAGRSRPFPNAGCRFRLLGRLRPDLVRPLLDRAATFDIDVVLVPAAHGVCWARLA
jgi:hypothetical protein